MNDGYWPPDADDASCVSCEEDAETSAFPVTDVDVEIAAALVIPAIPESPEIC